MYLKWREKNEKECAEIGSSQRPEEGTHPQERCNSVTGLSSDV